MSSTELPSPHRGLSRSRPLLSSPLLSVRLGAGRLLRTARAQQAALTLLLALSNDRLPSFSRCSTRCCSRGRTGECTLSSAMPDHPHPRNTVQHGTTRHHMEQHRTTEQHGTTRYITVQHGTSPHTSTHNKAHPGTSRGTVLFHPMLFLGCCSSHRKGRVSVH